MIFSSDMCGEKMLLSPQACEHSECAAAGCKPLLAKNLFFDRLPPERNAPAFFAQKRLTTRRRRRIVRT